MVVGTYTLKSLVARPIEAALQEAAQMVSAFVDESRAEVADGDPVAETLVMEFGWLPRKYILRYDADFLARFLGEVDAMGAAIEGGMLESPRSTAQELALRAIYQEAASLLVAEAHKQQLEATEDEVFWDWDVEILFNPSMDGAEDDELWNSQIRTANLRFEDWFIRFEGADW